MRRTLYRFLCHDSEVKMVMENQGPIQKILASTQRVLHYGHKSQTALLRIPRQHLIQRIQLSHLRSAGRSQCSRILTVNGFCCCTSFFPCSRTRPRRLSTMKSADTFPSGCGESALNFCSLGFGLATWSFDPTTASNNCLYHELDYSTNILFSLPL